MSQRVFLSLSRLMLALGFLTALAVPSTWAQKPKEPKWTHAFDLMVRKYGEADFTDKTQKFGVEVFKDTNTNYGLYIAQTGFLGGAPGFDAIAGAIKDSKGAKWTAGLDLPARGPGEKEFSNKTKSWALEVFHDPNAGNWIYITEIGTLSVVAGPSPPPGGMLRAPKWVHSVDLRCRKGGIREWKDSPLYGIEIYRDQNTGNLIYISNVGGIAVIADSAETKPADGKAPEWLHGLDLACRRSKEPDFTKDTKRWGVEVFRDENNGNLIYITETGALAVARGKANLKAPTPNVKEPVWTHGLNLSARKAGEKEFTERTTAYGAEVFRDDNTGLYLYIAETGAISIIPTR